MTQPHSDTAASAGASTIAKELLTTPIEVRFYVGPIGLITIDAKGIPDQIVLLFRRTTEEFIAVGLIAKPTEMPQAMRPTVVPVQEGLGAAA